MSWYGVCDQCSVDVFYVCPVAVVGVMPWRKGSALDTESEVGSVGYRAQGCLRATVVAKAGWDDISIHLMDGALHGLSGQSLA